MTAHLMNTYARMPVKMVRGQGAWLYDDAGNAYLDALTGIGVCSLGHCHPAISAAIADQAGTLLHAANVARIPLQEELADRLAALSGMDQAFFCNSGAESLECAFKLARLHGHRMGINAPQVVSLSQSFHGRTLACISATDSAKVQAGFEPLVPGFLKAPFDDAAALVRLAEERDDIAAVLFEPIQGEGGVMVPHDGYLAEVRRICDQFGWLMIADEVQTGVGKTGDWFACQHEGILPDVITLAKALGNGVPIGACLARRKAAELFVPGKHGSTYGGNPLACRVGLTVLEVMEGEGIIERTRELGKRIRASLREALADHDHVREVRGRGLMIGVELTEDCPQLVGWAMEQGMIMNVTRGNTIRLLPPLIIDDSEADRIVDTVSRAVQSLRLPAAV
ncbi:MAG: aspartate aminotransferase family protein [Pseudomonadota bacterium]